MELPQPGRGTGVQAGHSRHVQHEVPDRFGRCVHCRPHPTLEEVHVREEQPVGEAVHDHPGSDHDVGIAGDVGVPEFSRRPTQHSIVWTGDPTDHVE